MLFGQELLYVISKCKCPPPLHRLKCVETLLFASKAEHCSDLKLRVNLLRQVFVLAFCRYIADQLKQL